MKKINLAIIFGGNSSEYSVSLHSTASVLNNINKDRYNLVLIGISKDGEWFKYHGDADTLEHDLWMNPSLTKKVYLSPTEGFMVLDDGLYHKIDIDCVFPVLHGIHGEDGTLQGLLELIQIPYVGCNHTTSAIAMDKEFTHIICEAKGILMAPFTVAYKHSYKLDQVLQETNNLKLPFFVKPANAGSSYGISKIDDLKDLDKAIKFAFEHDEKVLIEQGISGFEVGCSIMGNENMIVGELDEIDTSNSFFDFEAKYALENTKIHCPARLDLETSQRAKTMAQKIYKILGCKGLSRIDMFVDDTKEIYFNEINTIPGFTSSSRYPTMMSKIGIDFKSLIDSLVDLALKETK
ncbi:MAG: D-alanine--D-alanine ligase family protein [Anaerorhabdus sp.]